MIGQDKNNNTNNIPKKLEKLFNDATNIGL